MYYTMQYYRKIVTTIAPGDARFANNSECGCVTKRRMSGRVDANDMLDR